MRKNNSTFVILSILFGLNVLAWIAVYGLRTPQFLEVTFFDVGQGDAIFIQTPQRHQILIDGGPDSTILEKLAKEMPFWDREIDLIILTHPESDHLVGLIEVLKRYKVENILWAGIVRDTVQYKEWLQLIKEEKANIKTAQVSQKVIASKTFLQILYPFENLEGQESKDSNNTSIVAKLVFDKNSFLFTGDIHKLEEKKLIEGEEDIDSDILKVSHHGSKTSSDEDFIKKVSPNLAVIHCGKDNSYGHPHQETLDALVKYGINILRTDQEGDIKIISDGIKYKIK